MSVSPKSCRTPVPVPACLPAVPREKFNCEHGLKAWPSDSSSTRIRIRIRIQYSVFGIHIHTRHKTGVSVCLCLCLSLSVGGRIRVKTSCVSPVKFPCLRRGLYVSATLFVCLSCGISLYEYVYHVRGRTRRLLSSSLSRLFSSLLMTRAAAV